MYHSRMKYIDVHFHFIRETLDEGDMLMMKINTVDNQTGMLKSNSNIVGTRQYLGSLKKFGSAWPTDICNHTRGDTICILGHLIEAHSFTLWVVRVENWKFYQVGNLLSFDQICRIFGLNLLSFGLICKSPNWFRFVEF